MEDSSNDQSWRGRGDAQDELSEQSNNNSSEGNVSLHNSERPQAFCEDTASKTIEYLRARLLAERATSKAAKEAAENNAKRLIELERMLEVETEQRKKSEEAMQEVMEKLRIARLSSASDHADLDGAGMEKHRVKEEREELEHGYSSNSTSIGAIEEKKEIIEANVNNNRLQEDGHSSSSSVKSADQRKEESIDFANKNVEAEDHEQNKGFIQDQMSSQSENKDDGIVLSSPSLQNQKIQNQISNRRQIKDNCIVLSSPSLPNLDIQDQMPNQSEIKNNGMVLSSPSLHNQGIEDEMSKQSEIEDNCNVLLSPSPKKKGEYYASTDRGMSISKNDLNEKGDAFQGPPAPEIFTDRSVSVHPRLKLEEKITGLFDQMGNEVAPLAGQDQKEFLRLKLHELMDQIVFASEKEIHNYENSTLQTFDCSSKFPALERTCVQKIMNDRNSSRSNFQPEVPCKGPNMVDISEADKISDNNSDLRIQNERAVAPSMEMIRCKRHENEYGHVIHCCGIRGNFCKCQLSDFSHTFMPGKEDLCSHNLFQNAIPINISQGQAPEMQACLENKKADELNCRSLSEVHSDDCRKEVNCTTHKRLYHDHENTVCFRRSCNHNKTAGCMDLSRVSGSDGCNCMPSHHGLNNSHSTSYMSQASKFYQRKDILPSRVGPSASSVRNCHNYHPSRLTDSCNDMPDSIKNAGHSKLYSEYKFSPLFSMQWSSGGTPLDDTEMLSFPRNKVRDALMALRNAKEQIQSSLETRQNLRTYMGMSVASLKDQNSCRQLALR